MAQNTATTKQKEKHKNWLEKLPKTWDEVINQKKQEEKKQEQLKLF